MVLVIRETEIYRKKPQNKKEAFNDRNRRENANMSEHGEFYFSKKHVAKVKEVEALVSSFFKGNFKKTYINRRQLYGVPFTAIKFESPVFPKKLSKAKMNELYYEPLAKLGVEIVVVKGTEGNNLIYRVR